MGSTAFESNPAFLFYCCLLVIQVSSLDHSATLKSYEELQNECAQYLTNGEDCSDRCLALVGHSWNDCSGKPNASISRCYRPDPCDHDNANRTAQCMQECVDPIPLTMNCQRAAASLHCYDEQFGHLIKQQPLYVPKTKLQTNQLTIDCSLMLDIPEEKMLRIAMNGYSSTPEGPCLSRCMMIRAGLYSDDQGPNIGRFSIQCDGYGDGYAQFVTGCYEKLRSKQLDKCNLAARVYDECIASNEHAAGEFNILPSILSVFGLQNFVY